MGLVHAVLRSTHVGSLNSEGELTPPRLTICLFIYNHMKLKLNICSTVLVFHSYNF